MPDMLLFDVPDRLSSLIRIWFRRHPLLVDLQPVQLNALMYLTHCSRYSNTPLDMTNYFSLTEGTVSQSLRFLKNKGLAVRKPDGHDRRGVHLHLSESTSTLLEALLLPTLLVEGESAMGEWAIMLRELLLELLHGIQRTSNVPGFGLCHSCRFHQKAGDQGFYNLAKERLSEEDSLLTCREHQLSEI